jgi:glycosyltransferase involved in cell wall biosynthesis
MTSVAFAIPGDINLATGGYVYDRRVMALLPRFGVEVSHLALADSFPTPNAEDLQATAQVFAKLLPSTVLLVDGLAYGAMPRDIILSADCAIIALVHHPLCLEAGLDKTRQDELYASENAALALARHIIVTSPSTAATLGTDFAIEPARITVAEPGTDRAARARRTGDPLQLLSVGSIVPRKAYDVLVRALAQNRDRDWRLAIVGPTDRSPEALAALQSAIKDTGLGPRIAITGPADHEQLEARYAAADVFVLPSLYEGYGMVLAEAMAHGLPIICTTGGAAAATVPDAAAIKVAPGDVRALGQAIERILNDGTLRGELSDAAWAAGQKLPRWEDTARIIADVVKTIAPGTIAP